MTGLLTAFSRWCFAHHPFVRLELFITPENVASQRVAERAGYTCEGLLRAYRIGEDGPLDLISFSLLPDEART
jgi:RimJ/RimL family protein N-acetyltransferase